MTHIAAIDPGTTESAFLVYNAHTRSVARAIIADNESIKREVYAYADTALVSVDESRVLVIEQVENYGIGVGKSVFETVRWAGRFEENFWVHSGGLPVVYIPRREVKLRLCGTVRANDAGVRLALLDRWGGDASAAKGTIKARGPLYGVSSHLWSALALAVTYAEQMEERVAVPRLAVVR